MTIAHHAMMFRTDSVQSLQLPSNTKSSDIQDVYIERFGINDARELVRKAHNRPIESVEQVLVVRTDFITLEAQNALLKVLEEPPLSTKLIFIIPRGFTVLPTLTSRFSEEKSGENSNDLKENQPFSVFLNEGYSERILSIEQAVKKKDTKWQQLVKQGLVQYITESKEASGHLRELEYSVRLLLTRGASNKMLFEHIALILPTRLS